MTLYFTISPWMERNRIKGSQKVDVVLDYLYHDYLGGFFDSRLAAFYLRL